MKITKFAQSTFLLENKTGNSLLIDPGKYNFEGGWELPALPRLDAVVITHKHEDHFYKPEVARLFETHNFQILTNPEIGRDLNATGIPAQIGGAGDVLQLAGFAIELIKTDHVVRDQPVLNFGLLIESDGHVVYHTSDTRFMEAEVLPAERLNRAEVICVPIGNRGVVMGIDDALYFCNQFRPNVVIPMHYDSPKDKERVKPEHFVDRFRVLAPVLKKIAEAEIRVLHFSESYELK